MKIVTEQDIIDDLFTLSKKLSHLINNRRNNQEFWKDIQDKVIAITKEITTDRKIFGW